MFSRSAGLLAFSCATEHEATAAIFNNFNKSFLFSVQYFGIYSFSRWLCPFVCATQNKAISHLDFKNGLLLLAYRTGSSCVRFLAILGCIRRGVFECLHAILRYTWSCKNIRFCKKSLTLVYFYSK